MCRVKNCCGCLGLRAGCIVIVAVGILMGLALLGLLAVKDINDDILVNVPGLVIGVVVIIALWLLLLLGVLTSNSTVVVIQLIGVILYILCRGGVILGYLIGYSIWGTIWVWYGSDWDSVAVTYFIIVMVIMVLGIGVDIYSAVVIGSYHHSLQSGESQVILPYPV